MEKTDDQRQALVEALTLLVSKNPLVFGAGFRSLVSPSYWLKHWRDIMTNAFALWAADDASKAEAGKGAPDASASQSPT